MKGKGSISLNVTDIINMRRFQYINYGDYYYTEGLRARESRVGMLNFTYKFGKADTMFSKKKNQRSNMQDSGGEMIDY